MLRAEQMTVRYPGLAVPALEDVSIQLDPGNLVVIAGPNGSGKSTLQRALLGAIPLASGTVSLDGRSVGSRTRRAIARSVAALPQREESPFPMSVRDAVMLGRWTHLAPLAAAGPLDDAAAAQAIARCDVGHLVDRRVDTLSGGEWQRVRLARTLAQQPRVLLLDEPNAALDVGHEMALFALLRSLVQDGMGIMVITHQLNVASRHADRIVLLRRGRVVGDGAPANIMRPDLLSALFEWPIEVVTLSDGTQQFVPEPGPVPNR